MARLRKEVQTYIVRSLAQFNTPQETVVLVKEEFGIDVTRQQCICPNQADWKRPKCQLEERI